MTAMNRRQFLAAAGAAGGAGLLAACGGSSPARPPDDTPVVTSPANLEGDLSIAALLASMENLLVSVYQEGITNTKEKFGAIPPTIMAMITAAQRQHREHAAAWNGILTGAGKPGIAGVNLSVKADSVNVPLGRAKDYGALLSICQELGNLNATTYQAAMGALQNVAALKVASSIHPVEHQHLAVLNFLLGRNPPADSFSYVEGARTTADQIG